MDTETPSFTRAAACFLLAGVIRFRVPIWSSLPQRPQFDSSFFQRSYSSGLTVCPGAGVMALANATPIASTAKTLMIPPRWLKITSPLTNRRQAGRRRGDGRSESLLEPLGGRLGWIGMGVTAGLIQSHGERHFVLIAHDGQGYCPVGGGAQLGRNVARAADGRSVYLGDDITSLQPGFF